MVGNQAVDLVGYKDILEVMRRDEMDGMWREAET